MILWLSHEKFHHSSNQMNESVNLECLMFMVTVTFSAILWLGHDKLRLSSNQINLKCLSSMVTFPAILWLSHAKPVISGGRNQGARGSHHLTSSHW